MFDRVGEMMELVFAISLLVMAFLLWLGVADPDPRFAEGLLCILGVKIVCQ